MEPSGPAAGQRHSSASGDPEAPEREMNDHRYAAGGGPLRIEIDRLLAGTTLTRTARGRHSG
jgi:hypothetical protein